MSANDAYAIVESGGKQYRARKGGTLLVDRLPAAEGDKVTLRAVMFRDDGDVVIAGSDLEKVKVEALVAAHERGRKLRVFKYRPKKGYRRRAGHRSELTRLEVTEVRKLSRRPAAKKASAEKQEKAAASKSAAKKSTTEKSTRKGRTAAKQPAASKGKAASKGEEG